MRVRVFYALFLAIALVQIFCTNFAFALDMVKGGCTPVRSHLPGDSNMYDRPHCGSADVQGKLLERAFIEKFTHYSPGAGPEWMEGKCKTVALAKWGIDYDPCTNNLTTFKNSGGQGAATAAVPQQGGSSGMIGGVYEIKAFTMYANKPLIVRVVDRYNTQSNCLCKMDLSSGSEYVKSAPTDNKQAEAVLIGSVEALRLSSRFQVPDDIQKKESLRNAGNIGTQYTAAQFGNIPSYYQGDPGKYLYDQGDEGKATITRELEAINNNFIFAILKGISDFFNGIFNSPSNDSNSPNQKPKAQEK